MSVCLAFKGCRQSYNKKNKIAGSALIVQKFNEIRYFWSSPSVVCYQPLLSGGTNFTNAGLKFKQSVNGRKNVFLEKNFLNSNNYIPLEMLFSSASGVDLHISPEAANLRVERVTKSRYLKVEEKKEQYKLIGSLTEKRQIGFLGKPTVNVLLLNLKIDSMTVNK